MRVAINLFLLFGLTTAAGQEPRCIPVIKDIPFKKQSLSPDIRPHIPAGAFVRLVLPLSHSDTLIVYELGKRDTDGGEATDPDSRLLITRIGKPVFRYAIKDLPAGRGEQEWGMWAVAIKVAHLCRGSNDLLYFVFQAGNQGGYFAAIRADGPNYRFVPVMPVQQGRIILNIHSPGRIVVWTVASEDSADCTACSKHYVVETMELDGNAFKVVAKTKTKKAFSSFQDVPLTVIRGCT
jgi:hypothetical protein